MQAACHLNLLTDDCVLLPGNKVEYFRSLTGAGTVALLSACFCPFFLKPLMNFWMKKWYRVAPSTELVKLANDTAAMAQMDPLIICV
jgi:hypothetical protein